MEGKGGSGGGGAPFHAPTPPGPSRTLPTSLMTFANFSSFSPEEIEFVKSMHNVIAHTATQRV